MDGHEMKKLSKRRNISHLLLWYLRSCSCGSSCHQPSLIKALNIQIQQTLLMSWGKVLYLTAVKKWWQFSWHWLANRFFTMCLLYYYKYHTAKRIQGRQIRLRVSVYPESIVISQSSHLLLRLFEEIIQRCWLTFPMACFLFRDFPFCDRAEIFMEWFSWGFGCADPCPEVDPTASFRHQYLSYFGWRGQDGVGSSYSHFKFKNC